MRLPASLLVVVATFSSVVAADSAGDLGAIAKATALYPPCALKCISQLVSQSTCSLTDVQCLCTNQALISATDKCVSAGCTIFEGLQAQNITMTMCGAPVRDKAMVPLVVSIAGGGLACLAFAMRMATLGMGKGRPAGADDYLAGAALILAMPPTWTCFAFRDNGLGKDIWTLQLDQIKNVLMLYYLGSVFYIASITTIKLSIISFILRVFPDQTLRRVSYAVMALVTAFGIAFVTATALQCWPADYAWQQVDSSRVGRCNDVHGQAWAAAACNIVLDLVLLVLPLGNLWRLEMGLKKKLMIMSMFSLGIFVTIISVIRLHTLITFANSRNVTWDYVEAGYWSLVEMHASIICACLPYCRRFLISLGASFLNSTEPATYGSKSTAPRKASEGAVLPFGKVGGDGQLKYTRDGEGDFVPLVEYPHRSWDKSTAASVSNVSYSKDSVYGVAL